MSRTPESRGHCRSRRLAAGLSAILALGLCAPLAAQPVCERVVAVGDLHGGYDALITILRETGLVDQDLQWAGGTACLVQLGDIVDRGPRSREILDYLMALERQAGSRVEVLLGNHEVMNLVGDLRYTAPGEFTAFAKDESARERKAGYKAFGRTRAAQGLTDEQRRAAFDEQFPPGWFAHRRAFSPGGRYGAWLLSRPTLTRRRRTLFVHGGLSPDFAQQGIEALNDRLLSEVREFLRLRRWLIDRRVLSPLVPFSDAFAIVDSRLHPPVPEEIVQVDNAFVSRAQDFLALGNASFVHPQGPLWDRQLALADEQEYVASLERVLRSVDVDRIVVAHTTQASARVLGRFDDRVFVIDTGAGPEYEGQVSALELRDGFVRAIYKGRSEVLVEPELDDAGIERFLLEAEVIGSEEIGSGITRSLKLTLSMDGRTRHAAFKTVEIFHPGLTYFPNAPSEVNFRDSYRFERAAYVLDRALGLHMVPVSVLRSIDGREGAVIDWIEEAVDGERLKKRDLRPGDPGRMVRQHAIMELFDALIANSDRNPGNQLYTTEDWKLYLIDHSRSFRTHKNLPRSFTASPLSLPRELLQALQALDAAALHERLRGVIPRGEIRILLSRRDKILKKIERDRRQYGDDLVLY